MKPPFATFCIVLLIACFIARSANSQDLPLADSIKAVKLFEVDSYCEGVVFDYQGRGYISWKETVTRFELEGSMRVFADLPKHASGIWEDNQPDGMCLDAKGNLYVAHYGMQQVQVLDPQGKLIRQYPGGNRQTSNVAFGGPKREQLFVTGSINADGKPGAVFRLDLGILGRVVLPQRKQ